MNLIEENDFHFKMRAFIYSSDFSALIYLNLTEIIGRNNVLFSQLIVDNENT